MTAPVAAPRRRSVDLARDDELLDALGRGELPVEDDEVAGMLAAWHMDVTDPGTHERARTPVRAAAPARYPAVPNLAAPNVAGRPRWSRRRRLAIAAAVVALAGGHRGRRGREHAGEPRPVTRLPPAAERRGRGYLAQARQAVSEGRRTTRSAPDKADALIAQMDDPGDRARLGLVEFPASCANCRPRSRRRPAWPDASGPAIRWPATWHLEINAQSVVAEPAAAVAVAQPAADLTAAHPAAAAGHRGVAFRRRPGHACATPGTRTGRS